VEKCNKYLTDMDASDYELSLPPPLPPRQCTCTCTCAASRNTYNYNTVNFENSIAEFVNNSIRVGHKHSQNGSISLECPSSHSPHTDFKNRSIDCSDSPRTRKHGRKSVDYNNKTLIYKHDSFDDQDPLTYIKNNWVDLDNDRYIAAMNEKYGIHDDTPVGKVSNSLLINKLRVTSSLFKLEQTFNS